MGEPDADRVRSSTHPPVGGAPPRRPKAGRRYLARWHGPMITIACRRSRLARDRTFFCFGGTALIERGQNQIGGVLPQRRSLLGSRSRRSSNARGGVPRSAWHSILFTGMSAIEGEQGSQPSRAKGRFSRIPEPGGVKGPSAQLEESTLSTSTRCANFGACPGLRGGRRTSGVRARIGKARPGTRRVVYSAQTGNEEKIIPTLRVLHDIAEPSRCDCLPGTNRARTRWWRRAPAERKAGASPLGEGRRKAPGRAEVGDSARKERAAMKAREGGGPGFRLPAP